MARAEAERRGGNGRAGAPRGVLAVVVVMVLAVVALATEVVEAVVGVSPEKQFQLDVQESVELGKTLGLNVDKEGNLVESVVLVKSTAHSTWSRRRVSEHMDTKEVPAALFELHVADGNADMEAACVWKGLPLFTLKDVVRSSGRYATSQVSKPQHWTRDTCMQAEIGFISYFENEILKVAWVDPSTGKPSPDHEQDLRNGEKSTLWIQSYIGHEFLVTGKSFSKKFLVDVPRIHTVGPKPDYASLGYTIPEGSKEGRVRMELERVLKVERVFTDVGFKKIKCPRDLWGEVRTYWNNNRGHDHRAIEEWVGSGFFVNWHEVNQDLVVPPMMLKRHWQDTFLPVVEAWTNTKLEATDIYGIRVYYDGAWLSNHVDREHTHAASAILNVDQVNVTEPWPVHIWDIHGKRHVVTLEPGYMLLYESARCMHGRPTRLHGQEYINIFTHYRPVGKPHWFKDETIGFKGPDISQFFNPDEYKTHDSGLVGEEAEVAFKDYPVDKDDFGERDEL